MSVPTRRRARALLPPLALALAVAGCAMPDGGDRQVTVTFDRAPSFYAGSRVKVLGLDVGTVTEVRIADTGVRVRASVDRDVPLPADAVASIVPLNVVGERNLVLSPWTPGRPKATGDLAIPRERTVLPVETDEALAAFTGILQAVDPVRARDLTRDLASSLSGNGTAFNSALQQLGRLTDTVGGQADDLAAIADNLHTALGAVRGKEDALGDLLDGLATATRTLAAEREAITQLVQGLAKLIRSGHALLEKYDGQLVDDMAALTRVALTLQGNSEHLGEFVDALPAASRAFLTSWNRKEHRIELRFALDPQLRHLLQQLGIPDRCVVPGPYLSNCPWEAAR
ncbi:MCE family protein [Actinocorallia sp. API 0066]|uniref:MCE family protein n=1 Tax=Actinocorallia sp. API 0066 TaxID=2896846 RepID=UPI001E4D85A7|nr:MlaD family protein [Actinocorallia sp. API 0066]MCD0449311.1 MCE family protein [Actinocorallia sp. API 0066]